MIPISIVSRIHNPVAGRALFPAALLLAWLCAGVAGVAGAASQRAADSMRFSEEWDEPLRLLRSLPVQEYGFVRSAFTFGEHCLLAIADRRTLHGADGLTVILRLMADPRAARSIPLLKVMHPELAALFGGGRISLEQYRNPEKEARLIELLRGNQEKWMRPIGELEERAGLLEDIEGHFAIIPRENVWLSPLEFQGTRRIEPAAAEILDAWNQLKAAIRADDAKAGEMTARRLVEAVHAAAEQRGIALPKLSLDVAYHRHNPFKKAALFYLLAAVLYGAAWVAGRPAVAWGGYGLLALGFAFHAVGLGMRWVLSGRAPLSNMFESFTFTVGGMVLLALIFERVTRLRLVGMGGAILGFIFMVLAFKAPIFDSKIRPLMPALHSSWLTYHVVTILLSYSAFALSFFIGVFYLLKDMAFGGDATRNRLMRRLPTLETLDGFNYRIIGVGFPLLTLGIVFGAVWAATAWGRPWGFDPKETWSAITWLIYAGYFHVRLLAGWKGRRAAWIALIGFAAVLFTYVGVNYLLPSLHSYA